jgi:hypothetical protein
LGDTWYQEELELKEEGREKHRRVVGKDKLQQDLPGQEKELGLSPWKLSPLHFQSLND